MPLQPVETLTNNTIVVTMNADRHVITDASVAIAADRIVAVGKTSDVAARYQATEVIDGGRFVVTPGMINTHVHITGEPLTRGLVPENLAFDDLIFNWLTPMSAMYTEDEERLSAQLSAAEMLKSGTTSFLEAGTVKFVDAVVDGLVEIGIRARIGKWIWDLPDALPELRQSTSDAIANLAALPIAQPLLCAARSASPSSVKFPKWSPPASTCPLESTATTRPITPT